MGGCLSHQEDPKNQKIQSNPANKIVHRSSADYEKPNQTMVLINNILKVVKEKLRLNSTPDVEKIFKASEHKFKAAMFHEKCDNRTNTIIIAVSANKKIYGGFTPCTWKKQQYLSYEQDIKGASFLFSLQDNQLITYDLREEEKKNAIMNDQQCGPVFGAGHDLYIIDQCNTYQSWNNIGKSYKSSEVYGSIKANKVLNGDQKFLIRDYQVWALKF